MIVGKMAWNVLLQGCYNCRLREWVVFWWCGKQLWEMQEMREKRYEK